MVLLAVVVVVLAGHGAQRAAQRGVDAAHDPNRGGDRVFETQMETVRRQLSEQVPAASTVYFKGSVNSLWYQRIVEFAAMDGIIVVPDAARADYDLSVVSAPASVSPGGMRLVVKRIG
ncbi:hypothetical protein GCM10023322_53000 [Rugosimonospora acidiphila]|uniref:Uncharacterized protein n=1 Tax=Rugosimonospora acidiphila TaxID=556531 RepID=A0ABP9SAR4_9ACTN